MPVFYAEFVPKIRTRYGKPVNRYYRTEKPSYHAALFDVAPLRAWFNDTENNTWNLSRLSDAPFENIAYYDDTRPRPMTYEQCFYESLNDYVYMAIEGTRLLQLKNDGFTCGYGAYLKNLNTGETCYACANGQFFLHEEIEERTRHMAHDPTDTFRWHPVLFPYSGDRINFADYIFTDTALAFPVQFNGYASFEKQIEWLQHQEGIAE